jgi:hypothetical protein
VRAQPLRNWDLGSMAGMECYVMHSVLSRGQGNSPTAAPWAFGEGEKGQDAMA